jgi:hypothetical protein
MTLPLTDCAHQRLMSESCATLRSCVNLWFKTRPPSRVCLLLRRSNNSPSPLASCPAHRSTPDSRGLSDTVTATIQPTNATILKFGTRPEDAVARAAFPRVSSSASSGILSHVVSKGKDKTHSVGLCHWFG